MEITSQQVTTLVSSEDAHAASAQVFKTHAGYTTFYAEYTVRGSDIVFHFFPTDEHAAVTYWKQLFPVILDREARAFFKAEYPTLEASFVDGVTKANAPPDAPTFMSWWMIAHGFANTPDPDLLVARFLEVLDQALDREIVTQRV